MINNIIIIVINNNIIYNTNRIFIIRWHAADRTTVAVSRCMHWEPGIDSSEYSALLTVDVALTYTRI